MFRTNTRTMTLAALAGTLGLATTVSAQIWSPTYSLDLASPQVPTVGNSDFLAPGSVGGPPLIIQPGTNVGLFGGIIDELDAYSLGAPAEKFYFSVDRNAVGINNPQHSVYTEAPKGQAAGDVYHIPALGVNEIFRNQDEWGMLPAVPAGVATNPPIDNLDALNLLFGPTGLPTDPTADMVFSIAPSNPYGFSGADILAPGVGVIVGFADLGLQQNDDVDALHVDNGRLFFSLAPGSPTLAIAGYSAADILMSSGGGNYGRYFTAASLGLAFTDNIDAISFTPTPGALATLAMGLGLIARRRRS